MACQLEGGNNHANCQSATDTDRFTTHAMASSKGLDSGGWGFNGLVAYFFGTLRSESLALPSLMAGSPETTGDAGTVAAAVAAATTAAEAAAGARGGGGVSFGGGSCSGCSTTFTPHTMHVHGYTRPLHACTPQRPPMGHWQARVYRQMEANKG